MNKRSKGKRAELQFYKYLQKKFGWLVWKPTSCKWGSKDIFGLFDIISIDKEGDTYYYQIKTNKSDFYKAKKKIKEWITKNFDENPYYFFVVLVEGKDKFRIDVVEVDDDDL